MQKLSHQFVNNVTKPGRYFDAGNNLHLLVRSGKAGPKKYWIARVTLKGKRKDLSLGIFPNVSLAEARILAIDLKAKLNNGSYQFRVCKSGIEKETTFEAYARDWIELNRTQWSNTKHYGQWISTMETYVFPILGGKSLNNIDTNDLMAILKPIWTTRTESATRIRERVERILNAAIAGGLRAGPNPANWRGHLEFLLPAPSKIKTVKHHASVPYSEMPELYQALVRSKACSARPLRFLILTAARTGEVLGCRWEELKGNIWTIPKERMKSRRPHRVPLSVAAHRLISEQQDTSGKTGFVFSNQNRPLSNMAMLKLLRTHKPGKTVHGFRSSFRIWAAEKSGCSSDAAEMSLAHVSGSVIERTYMRSDLLDLRRELMKEWALYVTGEKNE